jgi:TniQ
LPGEAIDSWLDATACRMDIPLGTVARALDLSATERPIWIRWLSLDQLEVIEEATSVSSSVVAAMTLGVFDGTALQLDPETHRLDTKFPFGALLWSRFCPECIRESDGRWQLGWRLGSSFACLLHNCLLADRCPNWGTCQRLQQVYRYVPSPSLCACGYHLGDSRTVKLPAGHVMSMSRVAWNLGDDPR